jgi:hypothetical protein
MRLTVQHKRQILALYAYTDNSCFVSEWQDTSCQFLRHGSLVSQPVYGIQFFHPTPFNRIMLTLL